MTRAKVFALSAVGVVVVVAACATSSTTTGPSCDGAAVSCLGVCTELGKDPANCGACGKKCAASEVCNQGACSGSCTGSATACSGSCVDTATDTANCGQCGKKCSTGQTCSKGVCSGGGGGCEGGTTACNSVCVDTKTDTANCGQCGHACSPGLVCAASQCSCTGGLTVCPKVVPSGDGGTDAGPTDASTDGGGTEVCVDIKTDPNNCGGCGVVCGGGAQCKIGDGGTASCVSSCGDGVQAIGEQCDDGNKIDNDACTNACKLGVITVAGNQRAWVKNALTALGESFVDYTTSVWVPAGGGGVLIESNDGGGAVIDYSANMAAGTHVLLVGGSGTAGYATFVNPYVTTDNTTSWHTLSCTPHWTKGAAHPITQFLPATYTFAVANVSYHMHHLATVQPAGAQLLGNVCDNPTAPGVAATRLMPSKATFTDLAFDATGSFADVAAEAAFMKPFIQGYLAYVRGPH